MTRIGRPPRPVAERLWAKVELGAPDECWPWVGKLHPGGYGLVYTHGKNNTKLAHRVAWEATFGPIPEGLCVLHRCDNPPCCNPAHLFLGTQADNLRDMREKGRARGPWSAKPRNRRQA